MHILFRCCVADLTWKDISRVSGLNVSPADFEKIAGLWLCDKNMRSIMYAMQLLCGCCGNVEMISVLIMHHGLACR